GGSPSGAKPRPTRRGTPGPRESSRTSPRRARKPGASPRSQQPTSMARKSPLFTTAALFTSLAAQQQPLSDDRATGAAAVTVEHCKSWLGTLASAEFEGRGTGQDGFRKA